MVPVPGTWYQYVGINRYSDNYCSYYHGTIVQNTVPNSIYNYLVYIYIPGTPDMAQFSQRFRTCVWTLFRVWTQEPGQRQRRSAGRQGGYGLVGRDDQCQSLLRYMYSLVLATPYSRTLTDC